MNRYPNPEELYALELAARRARSKEMGRMLLRCAGAAKSLLRRAAGSLNAKRMHHA